MDSLQNKYLEFEVTATFPELLLQAVENTNQFRGTDFKVETIDEEEINFCRISATKYTHSDIFSLGYKLAAIQYSLKMEGKIDW